MEVFFTLLLNVLYSTCGPREGLGTRTWRYILCTSSPCSAPIPSPSSWPTSPHPSPPFRRASVLPVGLMTSQLASRVSRSTSGSRCTNISSHCEASDRHLFVRPRDWTPTICCRKAGGGCAAGTWMWTTCPRKSGTVDGNGKAWRDTS